MNNKITIHELNKILQETEIIVIENIKETDEVFKKLMIDSIQIIHLICEIEDRYQIEFNEKELDFDEFLTVGDLMNKINRKLEM